MANTTVILGVLIPCYNEESALPLTHRALFECLADLRQRQIIDPRSSIIFVDDGSSDATWDVIGNIAAMDPQVRGIKLSRNFGHQNALLAGMLTASQEVDCLISMDADLQDDIGCIEKMVQKYREGFDVVYGVRKERTSDSVFKRLTARLFYKGMKALGAELIEDHADFRLMSRRVLIELEKLKEVNLFLRGIFPLIGFRAAVVHYERHPRIAGTTKYPLKNMLHFALNGITSFSIMPLRCISYIGLFFFVASLAMIGYVFISYTFLKPVQGWMSIVLPMYFLGGVQLLSLGIIGEYIARLYQEVKRRPRFIVEETLKY